MGDSSLIVESSSDAGRYIRGSLWLGFARLMRGWVCLFPAVLLVHQFQLHGVGDAAELAALVASLLQQPEAAVLAFDVIGGALQARQAEVGDEGFQLVAVQPPQNADQVRMGVGRRRGHHPVSKFAGRRANRNRC